MDYSGLVKSLRLCAEKDERDPGGCWGCCFDDGCEGVLLMEAADAIDELQAAVDGYEANIDVEFVKEDGHERIRFVPKWISVKERLPEHLTSVIVHRKDGGIFMWEYFNTSPTDECWIDDSMNVYSFYDVTHWMPLPTQPKEE